MKSFKNFLKSFRYFIAYISLISLCWFPFIIAYEDYETISFGNWATPAHIVMISASILTIGYYFKTLKKDFFIRCKFVKISVRNVILVILFSISFIFIKYLLVDILTPFFSSYSRVDKSINDNNLYVMGVILTVIIGPIFEEILFRGLIFTELRKSFSLKTAIILQSIIFAIAHLNPLQSLYTFISGIFYAVLYVRIGSLFAPMILHVISNLFGTILISIIVNNVSNMSVIFIYALSTVIMVLTFLILLKKNKSHYNETDKLSV